jgi:hypothetical protein
MCISQKERHPWANSRLPLVAAGLSRIPCPVHAARGINRIWKRSDTMNGRWQMLKASLRPSRHDVEG